MTANQKVNAICFVMLGVAMATMGIVMVEANAVNKEWNDACTRKGGQSVQVNRGKFRVTICAKVEELL